jgi:PHP family Zn ribbon phosphoesterase
MLPSDIAGMAVVSGLDVVALTDHNSCKNCPAFVKIAEQAGLTALPGMELTTAEEVHVLCLFEKIDDALRFGDYVAARLPFFPNDESIFGRQTVVDENDEIIGTEPCLLINATSIGFSQAHDIVEEHNGVMIPAHIDKSSTSLLSNLGFIPPDSRFTCAEVRHMGFLGELSEKHPYLKGCNIINNSDAHSLEQIHEAVNFIEAESKSARDILMALKKKG